MAGSHPSPFVSADDFTIPPLSLAAESLNFLDARLSDSVFDRSHTKDVYKGQSSTSSKGHNERAERILDFLRKQKSQGGQGASIKDIAATIKGCSEKTIQRELGVLIEEGLVRRVGERRWSQYLAA
jgi:Fic family protein